MARDPATADRAPHPPRLPHYLGIRGWAYAGRYPMERYMFLLHRVSGVVLILYLPVHLWITAQRLAGPAVWEATMRRLNHPGFIVGEFLILAAFLFHAANGIRLALAHFGIALGKPIVPAYPYPIALHRQRYLMWVLMGLAAVLIGVGLVETLITMVGPGTGER